ncbi:voltage-dependent calcium channel subunit alpha-2/delta-1-like isoform X3 [Acanthaster planci]|uniref:Voltage-dependent calcium channel subunit alpha-2/delta-1-like isoform X3 n=1 Tax=Acanthaster planci TaxID=133434 RepID=A0A8B7ZUN0_ACAPL|nr:voltage-dependent calcium channel subunit alpha-2/delta-1-like isoform X3 [Acanthaster planci]
MAAVRTIFEVFSVLLLFTMYGFFSVHSAGVRLPSQSLVYKWSKEISRELITKLDVVTGAQRVKTLYEGLNFPPVYVNGSDLVLKVANKWQELLQDKMVAVDRIVVALETAYKKHKYNASIKEDDVLYYNAKNASKMPLNLTYSDTFKSQVNVNHSAVQIPTDIWVGDKTILNGINATNSIDEVFRENYQKDPQLLWQYFGSADGFYRSYPAAKWMTTTEPEKDQYDVRRRGWYIQAASSPKNVMILIDTSGSTYGMTLEITKVSVYKALDTLGNDDFVNVAYFNSTSHIVGCFDTFVQANLRNKNLLKEEVKKLSSSGLAVFKEGLEKAFEAFRKFEDVEKAGREKQNQGAKCHQVILIFTDGGEADERLIFEKYNDPVSIRVFVFKVGTDSMVPADGVREMACSNKGYFSNIQSFGAVRLTTLDYVPVLSRPMVLSGRKHFQWSDIYLDVLGLGMMTTLTRPVYNKTGENNQQMLAVVGTDITTKNMEDTVPQRKPQLNATYGQAIGPEGYAFGINSNGYILLHPRLKAEEEIEAILELGYLTEPPNVDFLEVEYEIPEKTELRINMIDQKTGQTTMYTPIMSRDERYLEFVNMTYSYTFIENTTFSVAIAQPNFGLWEWGVSNDFDLGVEFEAINIKRDDRSLLIAPWVFCGDHIGQEGMLATYNITKSIQEAIKDLANNDNFLEQCDNTMVRKLLVDANVTKQVVEYWKNAQESNSENFKGVIFNAIATHGGLTRIYPSSIPEEWTEEEIAAFQDPWDQPYYHRALYTNNYVFAAPYNSDGVTLPVNESYWTPVMVSKAVRMTKDITHAVVAVSLDPGEFNDMWIGRTKEAYYTFESEKQSCLNESVQCYLLDDGGFIVATNQEVYQRHVGSFFGLIDGDVMLDLKNKTVYDLMTMNDFQAACPRQKDGAGSSGPRTASVPTLSDVMNFNTWAVTAAWSFLRHFLYDMLFLGISDLTSTYVEAEDIEASANVSCIKILKQYFYGDAWNTSGLIDCGDCSRLWHAVRIHGTNLLLVVTEAGCEACPNQLVTQAPEEPGPGEGPNPCEAAKHPRYRKRPTEHCYDFSPNESYTDCSSASVLRLNVGLLLALQLLLLIATREI